MKQAYKRIIALAAAMSCCVGAAASEMNGTKDINCKVGDNLTVGTYPESAKETQALIDSRPDTLRRIEDMGRGLVAVKTDNGVFVSWKWKGTESINVKYNLYKNGVKINREPLDLTNYTDINGTEKNIYAVAPVIDGVEGEKCDEVKVWDGYFEIPLGDPPAPAPVEGVENNPGAYTPGEIAMADLDGDGEYEFVLKWNGITVDAGKWGFSSICYLDGYELDGTRLWRISMGPNIRSGEHDTQFMAADFDGDGKAEVAARTADGSVDGKGKVIGDAKAEWYKNFGGKNLEGPLFLTVFDGATGAEIDTTDYYPQSTGKWSDGEEWNIESWGDNWGNRSERYLGAVGTLDGENTSFIMARGYYGRTCLAAWHMENGRIVREWTFDSHDYPDAMPPVDGQGYHNMVTADVDYDGKDEIIYGNLVLDDDGKPLYSTGLGHGDAIHVGDLVPSRPGLEVYNVQEWSGAPYGFVMRDARTGEILYGLETGTDNGRACTADIDPRYEGEEAWSAYGVLTAADGTVLSTTYSMPTNFAIYWDGDAGRELEDGNSVYKYDTYTDRVNAIFKAEGAHSINATKSVPCLQADIIGDWREELIFPTDDNKALRIYTTTEPTNLRIPELRSDSEYYNAVIWQNDAYNQPPHLSYYLGYETKSIPVPRVYSMGKNGERITNPDLKTKKTYNAYSLSAPREVSLLLGSPTALVNGAKVLVDNDNPKAAPYLNEDDRTMVPLRFISEAFGMKVDYDEENGEITVIDRMPWGDDTVTLKSGEKSCRAVFDGQSSSYNMDTAPALREGRIYVPIRFISEMYERVVSYYDGLIYITDQTGGPLSEDEAQERKNYISFTDKPVKARDYSEIEDYGNKLLGLRHEIVAVTTSNETDGSAVIDYDPSTSWVCPAGGEIVLQKAGWQGTPAAVVMFGDDKPHRFSIAYSSNGEDWQIAVSGRVSSGEAGVYEKYYFGTPPYPTYIKYISLDDEDAVIAEIASAVVE